ncbi:MAG: GNAT family N-acetyltransferase [Saprospiraceae bacterium]|uniref:GNAT family N-acetyltransferase n=1 Tax=Candidatus Opimibacter skivensis TaxID=2982028 RepID=A0A9D7SY06_9BACT|nr:GNAT family N-acetyltransferase [Candidatus Opimibacter skivensis]
MNKKIEVSTFDDIDEIFRLYRIASDYQRAKKTVVVWPEFDRSLVKKEIKEGRQWKIVIDDQIACIWAITFSDPDIWEEKNDDPAMYIHRIATNPDFRGMNFVSLIVQWAIGYAKHKEKKFLRLDTLGHNVKLIEYYTNAGFTFLGMFDLKDTSALPSHYHDTPSCLFEMKLI